MVAAALWAQGFDYVERRNGWNAGLNAAGLGRDSISLSYAEIYAVKRNGKFIDVSDSPDSWNAGARTRSIRHIGRVSFAGGFGYDYFEGRDMCGSMFIEPWFYPFDIAEFTPGRKTLETYDLDGRVAVCIGKGWSLGLGADFMAANYAKRKDLRHANRRLDFGVAPSVLYAVGDLAFGAAYSFRKNAERVTAEEIGSTPESYEAFFNKGLWYGVRELWTGSGIHLDEAGVIGFPVSEIAHGVSLQAQWRMLLVDAGFSYGRGHTGERGVEWHDFDRRGVDLRASAWFGGLDRMHFIRTGASWAVRRNRENVLGRETTDGITQTFIYGSNTVYAERVASFNVEYEYVCARTDLRVGLHTFFTDGLSTLMYPFAYGRRLYRVSMHVDDRLFVRRFEIRASLRFSWGGSSRYDASVDSSAEAGEYPSCLTEYYDRSTEYRTAPALEVGTGLRYNIARGFHVGIEGGWRHGFNLRYVAGANAWKAVLKVGYDF